MNKKQKIIIIISITVAILLAIAAAVAVSIISNNSRQQKPEPEPVANQLKELPLPEITGGTRGELGIDKNINESTIDEYLGRDDAVYRDMRMLEDPANYESIGGDRYLSGYINGFKVVPLPYIIPVTGLPAEVGETYTGTTLFYNDNGTYIANYEESMSIIEELFPKDKVIFLMCGGGGYAGMTKNFLVTMGWDETKIYNVGGYWYYKGNNDIKVKKEVNGKVTYDFDKVYYHKIDFEKLTKSKDYKAPPAKVTELKLSTNEIVIDEGTSFQLNVIVLPNEAANKSVVWRSPDESIATVSETGLVKGINPGTVGIVVETPDKEVSAYCTVTIKRKVVGEKIKVDSFNEEDLPYISGELEEKYFNELQEKLYDSNGMLKDEYSEPDEYGGKRQNALAILENQKYNAKIEEVNKKRVEIINKLVENKKTFIMVVRNKSCGDEGYSPLDDAKKILTQNNYQYFYTDDPTEDEIYRSSKLNSGGHFFGTVVFIKDGKFLDGINQDVDALKNEEELKNWLSNYLDIK